MIRTAPLSVNVDISLKSEVEDIFKSLGISTTEAITLFFRSVKLAKELPFDINIPNEETQKVMEDTDQKTNLVQCENFDDFVKQLEL